MSSAWLLGAASAFTLLLILTALLLLRQLERQQRLAARVSLSQGIVPDQPTPKGKWLIRAWTGLVSGFGQVILRTGLLSARTRAELELTLATAGLHGRTGLEIFVGSKLCLLLGLPVLASFPAQRLALTGIFAWLIPAAAAVFGLLLPDMVVRYRRKHYLQRVEGGLPDALDLLVICSQAGLGLTAAIVRVAEEMQAGGQDIGSEFAMTANELRLMSDSRTALMNIGERTGIEGLVRLGTTLVQSMQYGTPLSQSMRLLSAEMRQETLTRFENKAARIGVLLTLPMVVFILPCVFLVVGGPAAVQAFGLGG